MTKDYMQSNGTESGGGSLLQKERSEKASLITFSTKSHRMKE